MELKICHLYPDILNLYGDRGNILCMEQPPALARTSPSRRQTSPSVMPLKAADYDLFFIGGGQDFEQEVLLEDLHGAKTAEIKAAVERRQGLFSPSAAATRCWGTIIRPGTASSATSPAHWTSTPSAAPSGMIGNYMFTCDDLPGQTVVGFENHSGKTYLGSGVRPMGRVLAGYRQQWRGRRRRRAVQQCLRDLLPRLPAAEKPRPLRPYPADSPRLQIRRRDTPAPGRHAGKQRASLYEAAAGEKIMDLPQRGPFLRVGRGRIFIFHLVFGGYLTVQAIDQRLRCIAIHHGDRHRLPAF